MNWVCFANMAQYTQRGSVAIITVDNPPVNALSLHVRKAIVDNIKRAENDRSISSIILCGSGNKFLAGADIKEFGKQFDSGPNLREVCDVIESSEKPVICAIQGFALGGGLEIAISAHYRIVHVNAKLGFPEVDLGILPAAAGTQRFPRLAGLKAALEYIPTGLRFSATKGKAIGVVDQVVDKDLLESALKYANEVSRQPLNGRRASKMTVKDASSAQQLLTAAVERINKRNPALIAPTFAIKAVMASLSGSFEQGLDAELNHFLTLAVSGQAKALQYAFFAERVATQWTRPDGSSNRNTKPRPFRTIGIIGAGTMGAGIAMNALNAGLVVYLVEQNQEFLAKGVALLNSLFQGSVAVGKTTEAEVKKRLGNLKTSVTYESLRDVDLVVEAVYENLKLKQDVFAKLGQICKKDAILCSNTSALSIDKIASATHCADRVIGTHFFAPAYYMKVLENVRGLKTSPVTMATATAFGQLLGKVPVLVGNCDGFVGNRVMKPSAYEAMFLVEEGCSIEEVDRVAEDFGFPMGRFKVADLSGIDIGISQLKEAAEALNIDIDEDTRYLNGTRLSTLGLLVYNKKRFGRKTGGGWYDYERPGAKTPYPSDFVKELIANYRKRHGIKQRKISTQEIVERLFFSVINEGFKILEEGIATKPQEIDTICILGYGWPRQTGGPMFYASTMGLDYVYEKVLDYSRQHVTSRHWKPSPLLQKLASEKTPITEWHTRLPKSHL